MSYQSTHTGAQIDDAIDDVALMKQDTARLQTSYPYTIDAIKTSAEDYEFVVKGLTMEDDLSQLKVFLLRNLKWRRRGKKAQTWVSYGWRIPQNNQRLTGDIVYFPNFKIMSQFDILHDGTVEIHQHGSDYELFVMPYIRIHHYVEAETVYIRARFNEKKAENTCHINDGGRYCHLTGKSHAFGFAVFKHNGTKYERVSAILPCDCSVNCKIEFDKDGAYINEGVQGHLYPAW